MSEYELLYEMEVYDKYGNLKSSTGLIPSRSFVIQFLKHIELFLWQSASYDAGDNTTITATDVDNTSRTVNDCWIENTLPLMGCDAQLNDDTYGIVVGTGTGAESNTNYALGTKIAHGTGAGQLEHQGTSYSEGYVDGVNVKTQIRRTFHNGSGGSITVEEVALYCKSYTTAGNKMFCLIRDLNTQAVADDETLSVKYTISAAF